MANDLEQYLVEKAALTGTPIKVTLELSPLCNMNCAMCYIRHSEEEVRAQGGLQPLDFWESLVPQMKEMGVLFVTLMGGEPFLYPEIGRLYRQLSENGFYLNLTTNATLLADGLPAWLKETPPRYVSVSIYGASAKTYQAVTGSASAFERMTAGLENLLDASIPVRLNYVALPENVHDIEEIFVLKEKYQLPMIATGYCFPQVRRVANMNARLEQTDQTQEGYAGKLQAGYTRLTPEESAAAELRIRELNDPEQGAKFRDYLAGGEFLQETPKHTDRIYCHAGSSTFWITWQGDMTPCGMMKSIKVPVRDGLGPTVLEDAWTALRRQTEAARTSPKCARCTKREICLVCPAIMEAETGRLDGTPRYLCDMINNAC